MWQLYEIPACLMSYKEGWKEMPQGGQMIYWVYDKIGQLGHITGGATLMLLKPQEWQWKINKMCQIHIHAIDVWKSTYKRQKLSSSLKQV